jgi:hypothetical protein
MSMQGFSERVGDDDQTRWQSQLTALHVITTTTAQPFPPFF